MRSWLLSLSLLLLLSGDICIDVGIVAINGLFVVLLLEASRQPGRVSSAMVLYKRIQEVGVLKLKNIVDIKVKDGVYISQIVQKFSKIDQSHRAAATTLDYRRSIQLATSGNQSSKAELFESKGCKPTSICICRV